MKKIYIDGLGLVEGHFSGVGQYILGILKGMDEIVDQAKYTGKPYPEITVIIPRDMVAKFYSFGLRHLKHKTLPVSFRVLSALWYRGLTPPIDLWCGQGTYLFPRFVDMRLAFSKSTLVVFDLSYEHYRQYSDEKNALFLSKGVRRSVANAQKVIAISQNAKREIEEFYGLKAGKVVVATPATDPRLFYRRSDREIKDVKHKYEIEGDYVLSLSNLEPRKNVEVLIDAYCRLPKRITNKTALLLVGVNGWKTEKLFKKIVKKVDAGYNIVRPAEYVRDQDKPAIISGAKVLVYPSHYEGFGMPPLEGLACGVPVITSNNSSLPEVVGNVGVMIDSTNRDELYDKLLGQLTNNEKETQQVRLSGPERARQFSWVKSARVILDAMEADQ